MPERMYPSSSILQLANRLLILRWTRRAVMPDALILHIADALAFYGFRDHCQRRGSGFCTRGVINHLLIMAVDGTHIPAERLKLRFHRQDVGMAYANRCRGNETVEIHKDHQIGSPDVGRRQHGFPSRSLHQLAVAQHHISGGLKSVLAVSQTDTERHRQPMTERARG